MEREGGSNNGRPRFWSARILGMDITVPENGASQLHRPRQPSALQVQSLPVPQLPNPTGASRLINFFAPDYIPTNPAFHSSPGGGGQNSSSPNVIGGATGTMVVEEPNAPPRVPCPSEHCSPRFIDFLGIGDTNSMHHHQPDVAAPPPPSPPHAPHRPAVAAVPPPLPQHAPNIHPHEIAFAAVPLPPPPQNAPNNPRRHVVNLEMVC